MMIALKGPTQEFYSRLTAPRTVSNMYPKVVGARSCANHAQHIERLSRARRRVSRGMKGQLCY